MESISFLTSFTIFVSVTLFFLYYNPKSKKFPKYAIPVNLFTCLGLVSCAFSFHFVSGSQFAIGIWTILGLFLIGWLNIQSIIRGTMFWEFKSFRNETSQYESWPKWRFDKMLCGFLPKPVSKFEEGNYVWSNTFTYEQRLGNTQGEHFMAVIEVDFDYLVECNPENTKAILYFEKENDLDSATSFESADALIGRKVWLEIGDDLIALVQKDFASNHHQGSIYIKREVNPFSILPSFNEGVGSAIYIDYSIGRLIR